MLSKRQANNLVAQINATTTRIRRKLVYQFTTERGYLVLGFPTLGACVKTLFNFDLSTFYRLIAAAQVEETLTGQIGFVPDNTLRVLAKLLAPEQKLCWETAQKAAKYCHRYPTYKTVAQLVNEYQCDNHKFFD